MRFYVSELSHVNYAICDSSWEAILAEVLENHLRTLAYVKSYGLEFEVPYVIGSEQRQYLPDFIVLVDGGHGADDPLHLVIEVKGYRYMDANAKKSKGRFSLIIITENGWRTNGDGVFEHRRR